MELSNLPQDPAILLSYLNTKLRDRYASLEQMCDDMHLDEQALVDKMKEYGFEYSKEYNRFW